MTTEEKAKAYDEALGRAREWYNNPNSSSVGKAYLYSVFPELKESEDERMRNIAIYACKYMVDNFENSTKQYEDAIAWLEKQGKQKPYGQRQECVDCQFNYAGECKGYCTMKKDEQKSADKVEPKFKVGDWVVDEVTGSVYKIKKCIENLSNHKYGYDLIDGDYIGSDEVNHYHLWTIQDAKDGDVLVYNNGTVEIILLFKKWMDGVGKGAYSYAHTFNNKILFNDWSDCGYATHPATKEQRDLLFAKMNETGYEWDAEKKELNLLITNGGDFESEICEQKPVWSEEDEHTLQGVIDEIQANKSQAPDYDLETYDRFLSWLEKLKQRI